MQFRWFRSLAILFVLILPSLSVFSKQQPTLKKHQGYQALSEKLLSAHLRFLSHDLLEGRYTAERGQKLAANYIATTFERLGLEPIGDSLNYFQPFKTISKPLTTTPSLSAYSAHDSPSSYRSTRFLTDFFFLPTFMPLQKKIRGQVAIVVAPSMESLEKADFDVTDKVVLVSFTPGKRSYSGNNFDVGNWLYTRKQLPAQSLSKAKALLIVLETADSLKFQDISNQYKNWITSKRMRLYDSQTQQADDAFIPTWFISTELADSLLRINSQSLSGINKKSNKTGKPEVIELEDDEWTLKTGIEQTIHNTENVIGLLRGSDSLLKKEAIVICAHYDHIGLGPGNTVFNGADDNSSGTSAMLAVAEALSREKVSPKRSVLFIGFSAEEKGLLGSKYYTSNPLIPLDSIMAVINMDMIGRIDSLHQQVAQTGYVYTIGSDILSLELDSVLKAANLETEDLILDNTYSTLFDRNRYYYRSDHYQFAKNGVPSVFLFTGLHRDYHKPTDTFEKINLKNLTSIARLVYGTVWKLGQMEKRLELIDKDN
jgi:hypothetical protein